MSRRPLPSVTQVLQRWGDFENINPAVLEKAKDRGSEVHALCGCFARQVWIREVPEECQGYFESFKNWFNTHVDKVHLVEKQLTDPIRGYTGTPDLLLTLRGDMWKSIWDIKSPRVASKTWRIQTAPYRSLGTIAGHDIRRHGCLRLDPDGGNAILEEYSSTYIYDLNVFLSALNCWNYFDAN